MMRLKTINMIFFFVEKKTSINTDAAVPHGSKTYNHGIMTSPVSMSSLIFSVTSCCHVSNNVQILLKSAATVRIVSKTKGHQLLTNIEDL